MTRTESAPVYYENGQMLLCIEAEMFREKLDRQEKFGYYLNL